MAKIIRELNKEEIACVYTQLDGSFPKSEIRNFSLVANLVDKGLYRGYACYEGVKCLAYALFVRSREGNCLLLDYFAVDAACRGVGIGSRMLRAITQSLEGTDAVIYEIEHLNSGKDSKDTDKRRRRWTFYERNGCVKTKLCDRVFGVDMNVLVQSLNGRMPLLSEIENELASIYKSIYDPQTYDANIMFYVMP